MSGYIGNVPVPQATQTLQTFTATNGQTTFSTSGYTPQFVQVYLNGVLLVDGTDYTASNGSDIVLTSGAAANDVLTVIAFSTFQTGDFVPTSGGTFTGNLSVNGNMTVDTNTFFVNATNNRVAVGTTSPTATFEVASSSNYPVRIVNSAGTSAATLYFSNTSGDFYIGTESSAGTSLGAGVYSRAIWSQGSYPLVFGTNSTERMRIDASGNLLVGKTSSGVANIGAELRGGTTGDYAVTATATSQAPILANRTTTDGELIQFRKDNTTVGSIGSNSGYLYIGSPVGNDAYMWMGGDVIAPATSSGNNRDNAIDLGTSANRWKNLFLSGGVYLGGTGAANLLDDYEEGTWTPTVTPSSGSGTYTVGGNYRKIGDVVVASCSVFINTTGTASGVMNVSGLPFLPATVGTLFQPATIIRESGATGASFRASGAAGSNTVRVTTTADGAITWGAGYAYSWTLTYPV